MRRIPTRTTLLNASATNVSPGFEVSEFRNVGLKVIGSSGANLSIFVKGAINTRDLDSAPNFNVRSSARDVESGWDFVEIVDLEDGTAIDGDDGVSITGNIIRLFEVNTNELDWIAVEATAIIAGTVTVVAVGVTNQ